MHVIGQMVLLSSYLLLFRLDHGSDATTQPISQAQGGEG